MRVNEIKKSSVKSKPVIKWLFISILVIIGLLYLRTFGREPSKLSDDDLIIREVGWDTYSNNCNLQKNDCDKYKEENKYQTSCNYAILIFRIPPELEYKPFMGDPSLTCVHYIDGRLIGSLDGNRIMGGVIINRYNNKVNFGDLNLFQDHELKLCCSGSWAGGFNLNKITACKSTTLRRFCE